MNGLPTVQVFLMIFWYDNNSLRIIMFPSFPSIRHTIYVYYIHYGQYIHPIAPMGSWWVGLCPNLQIPPMRRCPTCTGLAENDDVVAVENSMDVGNIV